MGREFEHTRAVHNDEAPYTLKPFLKWAGSKRQLLPHIMKVVPESFNVYFEPFLGSAAVFFALQPDQAVLNDFSEELIATYRALSRDAVSLRSKLTSFEIDKVRYYDIRKNRSSEPVERAAEFIYLNKNCFNGLYRVNSNGHFNVPFGNHSGKANYDLDNIAKCSKALARDGITLMSGDFELAVKTAREGDLVYFDPPYVTKHNFNGFRDYNEKLFSWNDQVRLATVARSLVERGVFVIVSNAAHQDIKDLYVGFETYEFSRSSTLASQSSKRGSVNEVIFYNKA
jgi:DNA adenine methylase